MTSSLMVTILGWAGLGMTKWGAALKKYYALRDEAQKKVRKSRRVWLGTPFSLFSNQYGYSFLSFCMFSSRNFMLILFEFCGIPSPRRAFWDVSAPCAFGADIWAVTRPCHRTHWGGRWMGILTWMQMPTPISATSTIPIHSNPPLTQRQMRPNCGELNMQPQSNRPQLRLGSFFFLYSFLLFFVPPEILKPNTNTRY